MKAFQVTSPAHEAKIIFARTPNDAAEIIVAWQILNGIDAAEFAVDPYWARSLAQGERKQLNEALGWEVSGIGLRRPDGGWGVRQPRDERDEPW